MRTKPQTLRAMKRPAKAPTKPLKANDPGMPGYRKGGMVGKGKC